MKRYFIAEIGLLVLTLLCILALGLTFSSCQEEIQKKKAENPVQSAQDRCFSKISGSRPSCWTEGDWIIFCKHVQCKETK